MKIGVIVFPGSNRDHDAWYTLTANLGVQAEYVWHDVTTEGGAPHSDEYLLLGA